MQMILSKNKPTLIIQQDLVSTNIDYMGYSARYSGLVSNNVDSALNYCLQAKVVTTVPQSTWPPLKIYNLGVQTNLKNNLR